MPGPMPKPCPLIPVAIVRPGSAATRSITGTTSGIVSIIPAQAALSLGRLTGSMKDKAARGEEFLPEDREFHLLLMQTTGNDLAVQLTGAFWDVHAIAAHALEPVQEPVPELTTTAHAHIKIVEALEQGDAALLQMAIEEHYQPIRDRIKEISQRHACHEWQQDRAEHHQEGNEQGQRNAPEKGLPLEAGAVDGCRHGAFLFGTTEHQR